MKRFVKKVYFVSMKKESLSDGIKAKLLNAFIFRNLLQAIMYITYIF
jgi:hypothetical protein